MPAITLGLAEIEERLHVLRRRLNGVTLLHAACVSLSSLFLVAAALVAVGLRGDGASFRVATWSAAGVVGATLAACAIAARRRWLDMPGTAALADHRGQLTDRLTTLLDLRRRPRVSRLAPVLIAQTLALGERWRPQRIVPRRVPRSLFLALLSLLALTASPLVAPAPPAMPPAKSPAEAPPAPPAAAVPIPPSLAGSRSSAKDAAGGDAAGGDAAHPAVELQAPQSLAEPLAQQPPPPSESAPDAQVARLPDRLRNAIRSTFHAGQRDQESELGKGESGQSSARASTSAPDQRAAAPPDGTQGRRPGAAGTSEPQRAPGAGMQPRGDSNAGGHPQRPQNGSDDQRPGGSAPNAGTGSSPENLLGAATVAGESERGGAPTFKLTIASFLRAVEEKHTPPRQTGKRGASVGAAADTAEAMPALNEQQLRDDALRKAEIPPEYEDIVRRVYSSREPSDGSR